MDIETEQQEFLKRIDEEFFFNFSLEVAMLKDQADGFAAFGEMEKSADVWILINWLENQRTLLVLDGFFDNREN